MRVIDNDPLDRPIIGKMIEEGCGVGQLVDNCIYLIADPKSEMAKKAVEYMEEFKRRSPEGTTTIIMNWKWCKRWNWKTTPCLRSGWSSMVTTS